MMYDMLLKIYTQPHPVRFRSPESTKRFKNLLERLNSISHPLAHLYIYIYIDISINLCQDLNKCKYFDKLMSICPKNVNISTNLCEYFKKNKFM